MTDYLEFARMALLYRQQLLRWGRRQPHIEPHVLRQLEARVCWALDIVWDAQKVDALVNAMREP